MRFSKDVNKNVHLQYAMLYKEEETQLVFMAQLKAYNVIPLHLECAKTKQKKKQTNNNNNKTITKKKKWNAKILITRPRVQDEQFDTILTEIITCFTLCPSLKVDGVYFFFWNATRPPFGSRPPFLHILDPPLTVGLQ